MKTIRVVVTFATLVVASNALPETRPVPDRDASDMVAQFTDLCLQAFPDAATIDAAVTARGGSAVPASEVERSLHGDPGQAWRIAQPRGLTVVTLEAGRYRACGIRRMTPSGSIDGTLLRRSFENFVATNHYTLGPMQRRHDEVDGVSVGTMGFVVGDAGGRATELLMLLLSNYHGHPPAEFASDGAGGVGVEVRIVRQITPR